MTRIGDFGTPHEPAEFTFGYFGVDLRVHPDITDLAMLDLFASFQVPEGAGTEALLAALQAVGSTLVHPDDVEQFWALARTNRQTIEDLAGFAKSVLEALTARPTVLPSDSSAGQPDAATSSTDDSSSRALRLLEGRPDLQVAVLQAG